MQNHIKRASTLQESGPDLLDSTDLFHLMVDSIKDYAIIALDAEGRVASWNSGAASLTGYGPAEIIGTHFSAFYTAEDTASGKPAQELETACREGRYEEESWRVRKDGSRFWANVVIAPMRDAAGNLKGYAKVTRDISERRQMHEALEAAHSEIERQEKERTAAAQASEAQILLVLNAIPASIAYVDIARHYRFSNKLYASNFDLDPGQVAGKHMRDVLGEASYQSVQSHIERALSGLETTYETERPFPGLGNRHVHVDYVPDTDVTGIVLGFVIMVYDITERQAAAIALSESEAQYRFLAEAMPQIVWTGKADGNIDYYNERWLTYTGFTLAESMDWGWRPAMHPDDLQNTGDRWTHSFTTGSPFDAEVRIRRASDGVYRWHICRALPRRNEAGDIVQWMGTSTDVDDYKQTQATLLRMNDVLEARVQERTVELERSNVDLQQFAYIASHDLQEPLRMVGSFMQLLEKRYKGQLDAQADRWIEFAVDGAIRMQTLIDDLLTYSRVGTEGKEFAPCALNDVLDAAMKNLQIVIAESEAEVTREALPTLEGDAVQLVSLFQNLIGNALKYRGEQPPRIHVSARREGGDWRISVQDNGIGIAPEFAERIFVIFQRLHTRKKHPGTGIGLALCKRIVERHGGHIWLESEPGAGATFLFTLPAKQEQAQPVAEFARSTPALANRKPGTA